MRILLVSHRFAPDFGGIETVSALLQREWQAAGHEVVVATQSPGANSAGVLRQPTPAALLRQVRWAHLVFHNNICLRMSWPLLLCRRPWVVTTQTWLGPIAAIETRTARLKRHWLRRATNLYISEPIRRHVGLPGLVVGNPYDEQIFTTPPPAAINQRPRDFAFVGRLVSDKGVDLLLDAIAQLPANASHPAPLLTIIGDGPERSALEARSAAHGIASRVQFTGALPPPAVARLLLQHRCLVVPSRWEEPFGIVALEGLACGCQVVGSSAGGLPEAMGPSGIRFRNGDLPELIQALQQVRPDQNSPQPAPVILDHLHRHRSRELAHRYLQLFTELTP